MIRTARAAVHRLSSSNTVTLGRCSSRQSSSPSLCRMWLRGQTWPNSRIDLVYLVYYCLTGISHLLLCWSFGRKAATDLCRPVYTCAVGLGNLQAFSPCMVAAPCSAMHASPCWCLLCSIKVETHVGCLTCFFFYVCTCFPISAAPGCAVILCAQVCCQAAVCR
jgi:hypothetical protein